MKWMVQQLKMCMKEQHITQKDLARINGHSEASITNWFNRPESCKLGVFCEFAKILGLKVVLLPESGGLSTSFQEDGRFNFGPVTNPVKVPKSFA